MIVPAPAAPVPPAEGAGQRDRPRNWYIVGLLCVMMAVSIIDRQILVVVSVPMMRELGITDVQFGIVMGLGFSLVYALVALPLAQFSDRGNRVRIIFAGAMLWGVASMLSAFAANFTQLALLRVLLAVGEATLVPAVVSLIGDLFSPHRRALPTGLFFAMPHISITATFLIGGAALHLFEAIGPQHGLDPWRMVLVVSGALPILLGLVLLATVREPQRIRSVAEGGDFASPRAAAAYFARHARLYVPLFIGVSCAVAISTGMNTWMSTSLVRDFAFRPTDAVFLLGVIGVPLGVASALFWPYLGTRLLRGGRRDGLMLVIIAAAMLSALAVPALFAAALPATVLTGYALSHVATSAAQPVGFLVLQLASPPQLHARLTAVNVFGIQVLGASLGALIVGLASQSLFAGHGAALAPALALMSGLFGLIAFSCYLLCRRPVAAAMSG